MRQISWGEAAMVSIKVCDPVAVPVSVLQALSDHLCRHKDEWFTFLSHPEVEPTDWQAEQAVQPAVVKRNLGAGNRTWAGAHVQEVLTSLVETCRLIRCCGLDQVSRPLRAFGNPRLPRRVLLTTG